MKINKFLIVFFLSGIQIYAQTIENQERLKALDSTTLNFLNFVNAYDGPPVKELSLKEGRLELENLQNAYDIEKYDVIEESKWIPYEELGNEIELTIVKPNLNNQQKLPVLIYCHGGGWVLDSYRTHKRLVQQLAFESGYAVVFVNYSLSPEVRYPIANEEAYTSVKWVWEHGNSLGLDTNKIAIAGDSVGGNMATVVCLMAKERREFKIGYQLLFYPVTNNNFNTVSYKEFDNGYFLNKETMEWFFDHYISNKKDKKKITVSPLRASINELKNLPPAIIITAHFDVLRDEGEAYAHKLLEAGVPVTLTRYVTIHDFMALNALQHSVNSKAAIKQAVYHLKIFANKNNNQFDNTNGVKLTNNQTY